MAQILVRDVEPTLLQRLKAQAKLHGRSLQGELKIILIEAADLSLKQARQLSTRWHKRLGKQAFGNSASLVREDRSR